MDKVLERQLKKVFGSLESVPSTIGALLEVVSTTYDHAEEDRLLIERSMEISSRELQELNDRLRKESEQYRLKLAELERTNKLMIDRELKMIELKKRVEELEASKTAFQ